MKKDKQPDPLYQSDVYYDVVVGSGVYKGYHTKFVGYGKMIFTNGENEIEIRENKKGDPNWMECCWNIFINKVDNELPTIRLDGTREEARRV